MAAEAGAGLRTFWTGTITFGLVSVPVSLFSATRSGGVALRMIAQDGDPIERRYVCSKDGKDLDWDDIVRGYEVKKGKFVVVTDEELEAIEPRKSRDIDLRLFVKLDEIAPKFFDRAYYLAPASGSNKAYRLLAEVMEQTGRAGIATFVMRAKEYVIAIIADKGLLRAETLRFADEIRSPSEVGLPKKAKVRPAEVRKFEQAITRHTKKVNMREFLDDYAERLQKLVEKKERKRLDLVRLEEPLPEEEDGESNVIDLMAALRQSLGGKGKGGRRPPRPATSRKSSTKRATGSRKSAGSKKRRAPSKKRAASARSQRRVS